MRPCPLPLGLGWHAQQVGYSTEAQCLTLTLGSQWGRELAKVVRLPDGRWRSTVNRRRSAQAPTQALAMKWAERWVVANVDRLQDQAAALRR